MSEMKFDKDDYLVPAEKTPNTDYDVYMQDRASKAKLTAEHELETIEMHGVINHATEIAKRNAESKINFANYILNGRER